ncbi:MAG: hypothetical protein ACOY99_05025 [Pseudomonadota bacterium]
MKIEKREIARIQLDRAIILMLDEKDYVSAITLAGASEEILGQMLGEKSTYKEFEKAFTKLHERRTGERPEKRIFNALANGVRNGLKHYQDGAPLHFDPEQEAKEIVDRAAVNYFLLTQEETPAMKRFWKTFSSS